MTDVCESVKLCFVLAVLSRKIQLRGTHTPLHASEHHTHTHTHTPPSLIHLSSLSSCCLIMRISQHLHHGCHIRARPGPDQGHIRARPAPHPGQTRALP